MQSVNTKYKHMLTPEYRFFKKWAEFEGYYETQDAGITGPKIVGEFKKFESAAEVIAYAQQCDNRESLNEVIAWYYFLSPMYVPGSANAPEVLASNIYQFAHTDLIPLTHLHGVAEKLPSREQSVLAWSVLHFREKEKSNDLDGCKLRVNEEIRDDGTPLEPVLMPIADVDRSKEETYTHSMADYAKVAFGERESEIEEILIACPKTRTIVAVHDGIMACNTACEKLGIKCISVDPNGTPNKGKDWREIAKEVDNPIIFVSHSEQFDSVADEAAHMYSVICYERLMMPETSKLKYVSPRRLVRTTRDLYHVIRDPVLQYERPKIQPLFKHLQEMQPLRVTYRECSILQFASQQGIRMSCVSRDKNMLVYAISLGHKCRNGIHPDECTVVHNFDDYPDDGKIYVVGTEYIGPAREYARKGQFVCDGSRITKFCGIVNVIKGRVTVRRRGNVSYVLTSDRHAECMFVAKSGFAMVKAGHAIPPHLWNLEVDRARKRKRIACKT